MKSPYRTPAERDDDERRIPPIVQPITRSGARGPSAPSAPYWRLAYAAERRVNIFNDSIDHALFLLLLAWVVVSTLRSARWFP